MTTIRPATEADAPVLRSIAVAAYRNLAYYRRHGYTETHRAQQDGFYRVYFRKRRRDGWFKRGQPR